jgi:hypothetical protein
MDLIAYEFGLTSEFKAENSRVKRNIDMDEILKETTVDLVILGARHTTYLKTKHPDIPHSFFSEGNIFRFDPKDTYLSELKKEILSAADELFTVGFTLCGVQDIIKKYPNLKNISRI